MIIGIGADIVKVVRIGKSLARFGERFAHKILDESELNEFAQARLPVHFLARRFAAKEAVSKALGTGMRGGVTFRQINIRSTKSGRPTAQLRGRALELAAKKNVNQIHVSIADEHAYAVAFVIMES